MTFELTQISDDCFLDFKGPAVNTIVINGERVCAEKHPDIFNGEKIVLPGEYLKIGKNQVQVDYTADYSTTCSGMHHFEDTDGCEYVYTESEPNHAHMWFPCFDQPDMKARLDLVVLAPADWIVLGNQPETRFKSVQKQTEALFNVNELMRGQFKDTYHTHRFETGVPISTYLFCIVAGPFSVIQ